MTLRPLQVQRCRRDLRRGDRCADAFGPLTGLLLALLRFQRSDLRTQPLHIRIARAFALQQRRKLHLQAHDLALQPGDVADAHRGLRVRSDLTGTDLMDGKLVLGLIQRILLFNQLPVKEAAGLLELRLRHLVA